MLTLLESFLRQDDHFQILPQHLSQILKQNTSDMRLKELDIK